MAYAIGTLPSYETTTTTTRKKREKNNIPYTDVDTSIGEYKGDDGYTYTSSGYRIRNSNTGNTSGGILAGGRAGSSGGGSTPGGSVSSSMLSYSQENPDYTAAIEAYRDAQARAEAAQLARTNATLENYNNQKSVIRQQADDAARQAYISKMLNQRDLSQRLAAQGYTGGLSESANLQLLTDYENARNAALRNRDLSLNEIDERILDTRAADAQARADIAKQYADYIASLENTEPVLTYAQAKEQINAGNISDQVRQAAEYYGLSTSTAPTTGTTSSRASAKPVLTYAQTREQLKEGNRSAQVLAAANYYGLQVGPTGTPSARSAPENTANDSQGSGMSMLEAYRDVTRFSDNPSERQARLTALRNLGYITDSQMSVIMNWNGMR